VSLEIDFLTISWQIRLRRQCGD